MKHAKAINFLFRNMFVYIIGQQLSYQYQFFLRGDIFQDYTEVFIIELLFCLNGVHNLAYGGPQYYFI